NQIRSSLVTPGFFRGCLDVGALRVNIEMYLAAARAHVATRPGSDPATQEILEQNLAHMEITFYVDDVDVTASMARTYDTSAGYPCES
ncbi:MAG: hypothetical protein HGA42_15980, partial [Nostocales cyanobacterium W4_Combined_metabat2_030]|nr:hypothetical protein [Nostocales cyanobacterium W4_Combined_metabat2_030]